MGEQFKNADNQLAEEPVEQPEEQFSVTRRGLYAREEPPDLQERERELQRLGVRRQPILLENETGTITSAKYKNIALLRAKRWGRVLRFSGLLALILVLLIAAVVVTVWYRSLQAVGEAQVALVVAAPQEFTAGEEIIYTVSYGNESRVAWHNVELVFTPPRGFTYRGSNTQIEQLGRQVALKVGSLASGAGGELHVRGQLIGEQNETATARADLTLTPENFPGGRFLKSSVLATTITALPLDVSLDIPSDAASGERAVATITARNLSNQELNGVYVRLTPAPGLQLAPEDSDFSPDFNAVGNEWLLPRLASLEQAEQVFVFRVEGQTGEKRVIDIEAGIRQGEEDFVQRELTHVVTVSATEVVVEQLYNGSAGPLTVNAGETVNGVVRYHNVGSVGLTGVIADVLFEGLVFDPGSLALGGRGSYDPVARRVHWSAATVPELAVVQPQQSGELSFSFRVLATERLPTSGVEVKNHVLVTTATVDSPDLPTPAGQPRRVISDRAVLSLRSDLILDTTALYDDGRLGITSTGPLPPRVGETTSYTLRFRIGTTLNDVSGVQLTAVLPDGVRHTGKRYLTGGEVAFNERTGELVWTIPFIEGLTGRAVPHQELHVQVEITPGEDKRGQAVSLLNKLVLQAVDQFTDEILTTSVSEYPNTSTASSSKGTVQ